MLVFDLNVLNAKCPDRKPCLLGRLDHNDQLRELQYLYVSHVTLKWKIMAVFFLSNRTFKLIPTFKYFTYIKVRTTTNICVNIHWCHKYMLLA